MEGQRDGGTREREKERMGKWVSGRLGEWKNE